MKSKSVIFFSVGAALLITALILVLSFTARPTSENTKDVLEEILSSSDATPGKDNSEIKKDLTAKEITGYYIDHSDGWYYDFTYSPDDQYDGKFTAGFDKEHSASETNAQKDFTAKGEWKLTDGEIKLYSDGVYRSSMWHCESYIVDSLNYFVGKISDKDTLQQTVLVSKAKESGDSQVFNLYSDGKLIMEIIRDDGKNDASNSDTSLPRYQMVAGTYEIKDGEILVTVGQSTQKYYILNDGIAKWKYIKEKK